MYTHKHTHAHACMQAFNRSKKFFWRIACKRIDGPRLVSLLIKKHTWNDKATVKNCPYTALSFQLQMATYAIIIEAFSLKVVLVLLGLLETECTPMSILVFSFVCQKRVSMWWWICSTKRRRKHKSLIGTDRHQSSLEPLTMNSQTSMSVPQINYTNNKLDLGYSFYYTQHLHIMRYAFSKCNYCWLDS